MNVEQSLKRIQSRTIAVELSADEINAIAGAGPFDNCKTVTTERCDPWKGCKYLSDVECSI